MNSMAHTSLAHPVYTGSANPSRRAKQSPVQQLNDLLSDSESDAGQDSDHDSDFHPGLESVPSKSTSYRVRSASVNQPSTPSGAAPVNARASYASVVPILPKKGTNAAPTETTGNVPPPSRRGRKPSGLSRSAREAQRKLNHSIIEKARRTKINEALATLRELVPADYGRERDEVDDEEGADGPSKKAGKKGKKEEKEREFKLEILVRTVSFMKDLLEKVRVLEAQQGLVAPVETISANQPQGKKRKRQNDDSEGEFSDSYEDVHRRKHHRSGHRTLSSIKDEGHARVSISELLNAPSGLDDPTRLCDCRSTSTAPSPAPAVAHSNRSRLPSISSWLSTVTVSPTQSPRVMLTSPTIGATPDAYIDPALRSSQAPEFTPRQRQGTTTAIGSYLPSPPPSTRLNPLTHSLGAACDTPAALNLGEPYNAGVQYTSSNGGPPLSPRTNAAGGPRTPDEDSAASMLLEISASLSPIARASTSAERLSLSPPALRLGVAGVEAKDAKSSSSTSRLREGAESVEQYRDSPRMCPSTPALLPSNKGIKPAMRPTVAVRTVDLAMDRPSGPLKPQTPSSLLGMGGVERVMSRLGLGAREVTE